eukprot:GHVN01035269.1.p1 GENE.GHVN01035269.1~~GHVN01035269.1.p1  ORF type:complete len:2191 (+),score=401.79 GHVN01035269.1:860-7432(+)
MEPRTNEPELVTENTENNVEERLLSFQPPDHLIPRFLRNQEEASLNGLSVEVGETLIEMDDGRDEIWGYGDNPHTHQHPGGPYWDISADGMGVTDHDSLDFTSENNNLLTELERQPENLNLIEQLLESDTLIDQLKNCGRELVLLSRPIAVKHLIQLSLSEPPSNSGHIRSHRIPYMANEVLCCGMGPSIEKTEHLDQLFKFITSASNEAESAFQLNKPLPVKKFVNPVLAGYFSRILYSVQTRASEKLCRYLRSRPELFSAFIYHLDSRSISEVLKTLICSPEYFDRVCINPKGIVTALIRQLSPESARHDSLRGERASCVEVIMRELFCRHTDCCCLPVYVVELASDECIATLMDCLFSGFGPGISAAVTILTELIYHTCGVPNESFEDAQNEHSDAIEEFDSGRMGVPDDGGGWNETDDEDEIVDIDGRHPISQQRGRSIVEGEDCDQAERDDDDEQLRRSHISDMRKVQGTVSEMLMTEMDGIDDRNEVVKVSCGFRKMDAQSLVGELEVRDGAVESESGGPNHLTTPGDGDDEGMVGTISSWGEVSHEEVAGEDNENDSPVGEAGMTFVPTPTFITCDTPGVRSAPFVRSSRSPRGLATTPSPLPPPRSVSPPLALHRHTDVTKTQAPFPASPSEPRLTVDGLRIVGMVGDQEDGRELREGRGVKLISDVREGTPGFCDPPSARQPTSDGCGPTPSATISPMKTSAETPPHEATALTSTPIYGPSPSSSGSLRLLRQKGYSVSVGVALPPADTVIPEASPETGLPKPTRSSDVQPHHMRRSTSPPPLAGQCVITFPSVPLSYRGENRSLSPTPRTHTVHNSHFGRSQSSSPRSPINTSDADGVPNVRNPSPSSPTSSLNPLHPPSTLSIISISKDGRSPCSPPSFFQPQPLSPLPEGLSPPTSTLPPPVIYRSLPIVTPPNPTVSSQPSDSGAIESLPPSSLTTTSFPAHNSSYVSGRLSPRGSLLLSDGCRSPQLSTTRAAISITAASSSPTHHPNEPPPFLRQGSLEVGDSHPTATCETSLKGVAPPSSPLFQHQPLPPYVPSSLQSSHSPCEVQSSAPLSSLSFYSMSANARMPNRSSPTPAPLSTDSNDSFSILHSGTDTVIPLSKDWSLSSEAHSPSRLAAVGEPHQKIKPQVIPSPVPLIIQALPTAEGRTLNKVDNTLTSAAHGTRGRSMNCEGSQVNGAQCDKVSGICGNPPPATDYPVKNSHEAPKVSQVVEVTGEIEEEDDIDSSDISSIESDYNDGSSDSNHSDDPITQQDVKPDPKLNRLSPIKQIAPVRLTPPESPQNSSHSSTPKSPTYSPPQQLPRQPSLQEMLAMEVAAHWLPSSDKTEIELQAAKGDPIHVSFVVGGSAAAPRRPSDKLRDINPPSIATLSSPESGADAVTTRSDSPDLGFRTSSCDTGAMKSVVVTGGVRLADADEIKEGRVKSSSDEDDDESEDESDEESDDSENSNEDPATSTDSCSSDAGRPLIQTERTHGREQEFSVADTSDEGGTEFDDSDNNVSPIDQRFTDQVEAVCQQASAELSDTFEGFVSRYIIPQLPRVQRLLERSLPPQLRKRTRHHRRCRGERGDGEGGEVRGPMGGEMNREKWTNECGGGTCSAGNPESRSENCRVRRRGGDDGVVKSGHSDTTVDALSIVASERANEVSSGVAVTGETLDAIGPGAIETTSFFVDVDGFHCDRSRRRHRMTMSETDDVSSADDTSITRTVTSSSSASSDGSRSDGEDNLSYSFDLGTSSSSSQTSSFSRDSQRAGEESVSHFRPIRDELLSENQAGQPADAPKDADRQEDTFKSESNRQDDVSISTVSVRQHRSEQEHRSCSGFDSPENTPCSPSSSPSTSDDEKNNGYGESGGGERGMLSNEGSITGRVGDAIVQPAATTAPSTVSSESTVTTSPCLTPMIASIAISPPFPLLEGATDKNVGDVPEGDNVVDEGDVMSKKHGTNEGLRDMPETTKWNDHHHRDHRRRRRREACGPSLQMKDSQCSGSSTIELQCGPIPRVGLTCLEVLQFIVTLVKVRHTTPEFAKALRGFVDVSVSLFFYHKWNSLLHIGICEILQTVLSRCLEWPELVEYFFKSTDFLPRTIDFFKQIRLVRLETDVNSRRLCRANLQAGYTAHLLQLCQELALVAQRADWVDRFLKSKPEWESVVVKEMDEFFELLNMALGGPILSTNGEQLVEDTAQ